MRARERDERANEQSEGTTERQLQSSVVECEEKAKGEGEIKWERCFGMF